MNLDKYETFLACVQSRTFYDAANTLNLTASTVSKHISALENELGVTLFERTAKGLVLTPAGLRRLPIIRQLVNANERLMTISDEVVVQPGLNICSVPMFARFHLEPMLRDYAAAQPNFPVKIIEQQSTRNLLDKHAYELAFLRGLSSDIDNFDRIEFVMGDMGVVVADTNPLAQRSAVSLNELRSVTFVAPDVNVYRTLYAELFANRGFWPEIQYLLPREDSVLLNVRDHNSIGLLSSEVYDIYKLQGTAFVPFEDGPPSVGVLVRLHNIPLSQPSSIFWEFAEKWLVENRNTTLSYKK